MKLLVGAKADVHKVSGNGCAAINLAAERGQTLCMKLLVGAKADVDKAAHVMIIIGGKSVLHV